MINWEESFISTHETDDKKECCTLKEEESRCSTRMAPLVCLDDVKELKSALAYSKNTKDRSFTFVLGLVATLDCILYVTVNSKTYSNVHKSHEKCHNREETKIAVLLRYLRTLFFWKRKLDLSVEVEVSKTFMDAQKIQNVISCVFVILLILDAIRMAWNKYLKETCECSIYCWSCDCSKDNKQKSTIRHYRPCPCAVALFVFLQRISPLLTDGLLRQLSKSGHLGFLEHAKLSIVGTLKYIAKHIAVFAFYHPLYFREQLLATINVVRWLRYTLPIVSSVNKVCSNLKKFLIVYRQHRAATLTRRIKKRLWSQMTPEERAEKAALRLQCTFRRWKASNYVNSLPRNKHSKIASAILIQRSFRRCLLRNRSQIRLKGKKLQELCNMAPNLLTSDDLIKKNMLEIHLKQELKAKKKYVLLIRPNSSFSTIWKAIVLVVIVLDIVQRDYFGKSKGNHTLNSNINASFSLERYDLFAWLTSPRQEPRLCEENNASRRISRWLHVFGIVRNGQIVHYSKKMPWYCWRFPFAMVTVIREKIPTFIGTMLLLDIFITFFTGDFNDIGILIPQPFVKRWIMGLGLKLLTNPLAKPMTTSLLHFLIDVGPGRVIYWYLTFFGPFLEYIFVTNRWFKIIRGIKDY